MTLVWSLTATSPQVCRPVLQCRLKENCIPHKWKWGKSYHNQPCMIWACQSLPLTKTFATLYFWMRLIPRFTLDKGLYHDCIMFISICWHFFTGWPFHTSTVRSTLKNTSVFLNAFQNFISIGLTSFLA